ncbi:autotransporter outer membrane beta-barrel domain-containing protein [Neisseria sp. Ec49-e6-T10]|uniref:autotransporter family protein n=1 Tax=Neisseria sp. Ec49-e6-T10 TaxID=3140744 RepID=UPI003EB7D570
MNQQCKKIQQKSHQKKLKLIIGLLMSQPIYQAYALTVLNDTSFPPYSTTGVSAVSDDIEIATTTALLAPQINISTSGQTALLASSGKNLTVNSANPFVIQSSVTGGYNSFYGVRMASGQVISKSELEVNFVDGRGIYAVNGGVGNFDKKVTINSTGQSIGVMAYSTSATGGKAYFKDELVINAYGDNSYGIVTQQGNPNGDGPELVFDKPVSIQMTGSQSRGISTQDIAPGGTQTSSLIHFKDGLNINMTDGIAIDSRLPFSEIRIDGSSHLVSAGTNNVIEAIEGKVLINGTSIISGNTEAVNTGEVSFNLLPGSYITGKMDNYSVTTLPAGFTAGRIDLNFQGVGSNWQLTESSYINTLKGNGHFLLTTDIAAGTGAVLHVTDPNGAQGNHTVSIADTGTGNVASTYEQAVVKTNGVVDGTTFTMPQLANIGAYQYDIKQSGADWVLYQKEEKTLTPTADTVINDVRAGYLMNHAETQTLLQRMGELRQPNQQKQNDQANVWARMFFSENEVDQNGQLSRFHQKFNGVQIGADALLPVFDSDRFYLGGTFGHTRSEQSYQKGKGDIDSYYVGVYGTYIKDNGFYVDNLLKVGKQKQSFDLKDNMGKTIHSGTNHDHISWSTEVGYQAYFDQVSKDGWYVEPQAQITFGRMSGNQFTASNGMDINFDRYHSTLGRLGFLAGYTVKNDQPVNFYAKSSYVHEFEAQLKSRMNEDQINADLGDSWWVYGVGMSAAINNQHHLYIDVERSSGGYFKQLWKLNGGYRFSW